MKTFDQLTLEQKDLAVERAKDILIHFIIEGVFEVQMPNKAIHRTFEAILADMRKNADPKLAKEVLTSHPEINVELDRISIAAAEKTQYDLDNDFLMTKQ